MPPLVLHADDKSNFDDMKVKQLPIPCTTKIRETNRRLLVMQQMLNVGLQHTVAVLLYRLEKPTIAPERTCNSFRMTKEHPHFHTFI